MRTVKTLHGQGQSYGNGADERPMEDKHGVNKANTKLVGFTGGPNGKIPGLCNMMASTEYLPYYTDTTFNSSALQDEHRTDLRRARVAIRHQTAIGHPTPMATPTIETPSAAVSELASDPLVPRPRSSIQITHIGSLSRQKLCVVLV